MKCPSPKAQGGPCSFREGQGWRVTCYYCGRGMGDGPRFTVHPVYPPRSPRLAYLVAFLLGLVCGFILSHATVVTYTAPDPVVPVVHVIPSPTPTPYAVRGVVSWYGEADAECLGCSPDRVMACGSRYDEDAPTIAVRPRRDGTPSIPCGTDVTVTANGRTVHAVVADTGGFAAYGRVADLSKSLARTLGVIERGTARAVIHWTVAAR